MDPHVIKFCTFVVLVSLGVCYSYQWRHQFLSMLFAVACTVIFLSGLIVQVVWSIMHRILFYN